MNAKIAQNDVGFYRISEITALMGIHKNTWHNWMAAGQIDGVKVPLGRRISKSIRVFPKKDIHDFFEAIEAKTQEPPEGGVAATYGGDEGEDLINALTSIAKGIPPADSYFLTEAVTHIESLYETALLLERKLKRAQKRIEEAMIQ